MRRRRRKEWVGKWEDEVESQLRVWCGVPESVLSLPTGN